MNAAGTYLPPFTVYKAQNLWFQWTRGGDEDYMYGCRPSGWMEGFNFEAWFCEKFVHLTKYGEGPRLFIFDGHNSHLSYKVAKAAYDNNIHILCLPPHTSHALQPLDLACFKPAKVIGQIFAVLYYKKTLY